MPITLVSKEITVDYALALCYASLPRIISPEGLFRKIIQQFDEKNLKFGDAGHLTAAVGAAVSDCATEVHFDLDRFAATSKPFAQFKKIMIGRVGPMNVAILQAMEGRATDLADEARMLRTLRDAGLRTVPVYDSPETIEATGRMAEKAVIGNFLDCKEGFTEKQNVNIVAALFGIQGANREADPIAPIKKNIESLVALQKFPRGYARYLANAIADFKKIQEYLREYFISDLQGIMEFGTGRFYIIDPLKLGPIGEANALEKGCVLYVNAVITLLEQLQAHLKG